MNTIKQISQEELLKKVTAGVSKSVIWKKPLLLLTKDSSDYNIISDKLNETFRTRIINTDPSHFTFVRVNNLLEITLKGVFVDYHQPDVDVLANLGGPLAFDEKIHRYCVDLVEYEAKPVISLICVTDKNCSAEDIPEWMNEKFEILMLK